MSVAARLNAAWTENEHPSQHTPKFSFEYFPPKTPGGIEALYNRVYRMGRQGPLFVDLTWGAGGSTSDLTLSMSTNFKKYMGVEVNMHLTCTNITAECVHQALIDARANGITSICALRGDPPAGSEKWAATEGGFECALDLVKFIRKEHGDYFSVAVSGYPEGHPNAIKPVTDETKLSPAEKSRLRRCGDELMVCHDDDYAKEIAYLKAKVDAGAQVIITQLFFDATVFLDFVDNCRKAGIHVPILPGIMLVGTYAGLQRMTDTCKTRIPPDMEAKISEYKDDAKKFVAYGVEYVTNMCQKIWATNKVPSLHFYCLNQHDTVFQVLSNLGVKINNLDAPEDHQEVENIARLVKTTLCAPKAPRDANGTEEQGAQKKAKTGN